MTVASDFRTDADLFDIARVLFEAAGFANEEVDLSGGRVLLAENAYCIVALTATPTLNDLVTVEPHVTDLLRERVHAANIGPKLWDAYVVLLTQERPSDHGVGLHPLFDLAYNTHGSRRIARVGVQPTPHGVRGALTPFLAPIQLENAGLATSPLMALLANLVTYGIDRTLATRAVEAFRQGGHVDDIL